MLFKRTGGPAFTGSRRFHLPHKPVGVNSRTRFRRPAATLPLYEVTDRLHAGRTVNVPAPEIARTVAGWLAELGVHSPLVEQLAQAVHAGDWATAHAISDHLSVNVTFVS